MTAEGDNQNPIPPSSSSTAAATAPLPPSQSIPQRTASAPDILSRQRSRRRSAQDRINDILEAARERAESHDRNTSSPGTLSPKLQPLLESSTRVPNYLSAAGSPRMASPRMASPRIGSPRTGSPRLGPAIPEEESTGYSNGVNGSGVVTAQPGQQHYIQYQLPTQAHSSARRRSSRRSIHDQVRPPSESDEEDLPVRRSREQDVGRWKRTLRYFKSIELENKGSVARDHLALERTFLAWLRTSLAFASIGIAITQLFRLNTSLADDEHQSNTLRHMGKPLGATFLGISILILFLGYNRYLESQEWVIKGKFPASRGTIIIVSFIAFAVTVASLIVVVAVQSTH